MSRIREELPEPFEGYPAIGAYHEIIPNPTLDRFMRGFCEVADEVFKRAWKEEAAVQVVTDEREEQAPEEYNFRRYYRAYYATNMWVSVLDMSHSQKHARAMRSVWERQDIGDTQQIARDEIDRQMPCSRPRLHLDQVARLGSRLPNAPSYHEGRKLALVPNAAESGETIELLAAEHEIIISAIQRRLKRFVPVGEYLPHVTFAWFTNNVSEGQISEVADGAKTLAGEHPVRMDIDRQIAFRERLVRKLKV